MGTGEQEDWVTSGVLVPLGQGRQGGVVGCKVPTQFRRPTTLPTPPQLGLPVVVLFSVEWNGLHPESPLRTESRPRVGRSYPSSGRGQ